MLVALGLLGLLGGGCALNVIDAGAASIAKNLPFENKDAYFTAPPNFYGVFDGVSSMPQSRVYAQTLAKTSCDTLLQSQRGNPKGEWTAQACSALTAATAAAEPTAGSALQQAEDEGRGANNHIHFDFLLALTN